jgi:phage-related protein
MGSITIDCDAKTAYTVDISGNKSFAGRQVTVVDDLWPYMEPGENSVSWSGDAGLVIIQPWWRWL